MVGWGLLYMGQNESKNRLLIRYANYDNYCGGIFQVNYKVLG